jgi:hypothetical protein
MQSLLADGRVRAIGISNFHPDRLIEDRPSRCPHCAPARAGDEENRLPPGTEKMLLEGVLTAHHSRRRIDLAWERGQPR